MRTAWAIYFDPLVDHYWMTYSKDTSWNNMGRLGTSECASAGTGNVGQENPENLVMRREKVHDTIMFYRRENANCKETASEVSWEVV